MIRCPTLVRVTLPLALFVVTSSADAQTIPPNYTASLGSNLHFYKDWVTEQALNNLFKQSRPWFTQCNALEQPDCTNDNAWDTGESALLDLDPDGWVRTLPSPTDSPKYWIAGTVMMTGNDGHYPGGQYVVLYDGEGTIEYGQAATKNVGLSVSGRDIIDVVPGNGSIWLKITSTDPRRTGNYIRNIRVLRPGTENNYTTELFYSGFLSQMERYGTLRYMMWGEINGSTQQYWADRPHMTDARYVNAQRGVPFELMIAMSNRLHADAWMNVPHMADDTYVTEMATLIRNTLDPTLKIYIEYSNEVWNDTYGFTQGAWVQSQGVARWPNDNTRSAADKRYNWHGMRTAQICDIFKNVFGTQRSRVKCVLGAQSENTYTVTQALDCPMWTEGAPCYAHGIDAVAIAPYIAFPMYDPNGRAQTLSLAYGPNAVDNLFTEITTGGLITQNGLLANLNDRIAAASAAARARGIELYAYEGGSLLMDPSRDPVALSTFQQMDRDARMTNIYLSYLNGWRTNGGSLFMHFVHTARPDNFGSVGLLEYLDSTTSPKFDAISQFMTQNACWWGCRCGDGVVDRGETCDDGNRASGDCCTSLCQLEPVGTLCRSSGGVCDVSDYCTGTSGFCPADAKSTAVCRPVANACDVAAESCNGATNSCPADTARDCSYLASACSSASCDPVLGCVSTAINENGTCNDGNAATLIDVCYRGTCVSGNPAPTLNALAPSSAQLPTPTSMTWTVNGSNFVSSSQVLWGNTSPTTVYLSPTQLRVTLTSAQYGVNGVYPVRVVNPIPGGGTSVSRDFTITNPAPSLFSVTPNALTAGLASTTITLTGVNFTSNSDARLGTNSLTVLTRTATQLTASVPFSLLVAGNTTVSVVNSAPGGGTSATQNVTISNPVPVLTTLTPASAQGGVNAAQQTITLDGSSFVPASLVRFNGTLVTTTYVSATRLTAVVPVSLVTTVGSYNVTVEQGTPGGGTSAAQVFTVSDPTPVLTTLTPATATAGGASFTMTLTGSNFTSSSRVNLAANALATTYVSPTQLTVTVTSQLLQTGGYYGFSVTTGAATSATRQLVVNNPVPVLTSISPTYAPPGSSSTVITVTGSSFVGLSTIQFGTTSLTATFVSSTQLTATIPSSALTASGTANVSVVNPTPGGGTSGTQVFTINNPLPVLTSITPSSATAGDASQIITVNGSSFITSSVVQLDGAALATTYVSSTQLTATIPSATLAAAGTHTIAVFTPTPGGGTSATATYTTNNPLPVLTSITPTSGTAGASSAVITVNGSAFVSSSVVQWDGAALTTTYVSATQLTATLGATQLASAGTHTVTVLSPTPGGGTSASATYTTNNPVPVVTSLSPAASTVGGASQVVTVNGSSFVSGSVVQCDGVALATTYVSSTQLTATLGASQLATAGTRSITVFTGTPGGGTSGSSTYTVNQPTAVLTSLAPTSATANTAGFTLTLNGSSFISGASVTLGGTALTTTFVSSTQLTAVVPSSLIVTAATLSAIVTNPAPTAASSGAATFTVNNPAPTLTYLSPSNVSAGTASMTITLNGTNFVPASQVTYAGASITPTFVSSTQLTIRPTAAQMATAGTYPIVVTNAAPGGGTSATQNLSVIANPAPTITSMTPGTIRAGSAAFRLTLNGTNFVSGGAMVFGGTRYFWTFVSSTQVYATIAASSVATAGTYTVTAQNPFQVGASGGAQSFVVTAQ